MKQSHVLRCEVVPVVASSPPKGAGNRLQEEVQRRLDCGWTLRAAPATDGMVYLIFVRKEAK